MRFTRRQGLPALAGLLIVALALTARGLTPDFFERAQLLVFDSLQRAKPWEIITPQVRVVDIDDASLKRVGQWPWSRSILAKLVVALQDMQARSIAFDVVFAEPDRTSPARLVAEWRQSFAWRAPAGPESSLPDYDSDLAAAFARGRIATGFGLLAQANGAAPTIAASVATIGGDPALTVENFGGAVPNLKVLETSAAGNGSLSITAGRDQIVRALPLLSAFDGKLVPSLALEALRVAEDEDTIGVRAERNGGAAGPITGYTVRVGAFETPMNADGSLLLHHGALSADATISAWRLLDPDARANLAKEIAGRIVLVGTSAVGLSDLRATPLNPLEPGVNLHARAIEQMLSGHFLSRPAWAPGAEWVAAAALGIALVALVSLASLQTAALAMALSVIFLVAATWIAFSFKGLLLDPSLVGIVAIPGALSASFARYFVAERDASKLRSAFTHYLSPALVEALARDPDGLKLGGEQREMTFLFTDLEAFTSLIEGADAPDIVTWLNDYLDGLCRIAMDHGGTVDKIVGDAVHVMFNAPLDQPDHAERAVRCALAIDGFAQRYRAQLQARGVPFGATRIGVNTGWAVVGNFGGGRRFDYTAHGDAINTAARLESANKALGTRICVARATIERVGSVAFLPVGTLTLKGKTQGVDVFAPADADPWAAEYLDAFERISNGDEAGSTALLVLAERYPDHPILALHARRIRAGERSLRMAA
jgi:adenylate cyclase